MTTSRGGRALLLIDLENLVGGSCAAPEQVRRALAVVCAECRAGDLVVIACGPTLFAATAWEWPSSARRLLGRGVNGADHALLEVLHDEGLVGRFGRLLLASGDAAFAAPVAQLAAKGLPTTVVSCPSALARRLRMAATDVLALPMDLRAHKAAS